MDRQAPPGEGLRSPRPPSGTPMTRRTRTLRGLAGAAERLTLCKADLLDGDALRDAIAGCHGVFHTASPVTDDPVRGDGGAGGEGAHATSSRRRRSLVRSAASS
ncbi:hypothetical protein ACQ4PT_008966 [Festuca glaucescens]